MNIIHIPASNLTVNHATNSRRTLEGIEELAKSIKKNGLLQPLVVRRTTPTGESFDLVAGFRRHAALLSLEVSTFPCVETTEDVRPAIANLVENLERMDLRSYDFAVAVKKLRDDGMTTNQISAFLVSTRKDSTGTSVSNINNVIRLLEKLDERIIKEWAANHDMASTGNLLTIVKAEDQWAAWQALNGTLPPAEGDTDGDHTDEGDDASDVDNEPKASVRRMAVVVKMMDILGQNSTIDTNSKKIALSTLRWVIGDQKTLLGCTTEQAPPKAHSKGPGEGKQKPLLKSLKK